LNASQIEYTQTKRDYSPIITTSKYDLRRIYDPQFKNTTMGLKAPLNVSQPSLMMSENNRMMLNS
jgi:hypothetical protein